MEDRLLYDVLKSIVKTKICSIEIVDHDYYKSLERVGIISMDWDTYLTKLGQLILETLTAKFEKW